METSPELMDSDALYTEDYTIEKIVYINSATHAFSEFTLDKHLALFGGNNKGKTATLSGTKIILFPEVNFKNTEKKFSFKSREGNYYTKEDSYNFYFPSTKTFIVMQVNNPFGQFCIVLYKGTDFHYHRAFLPVPFSDIKHLFFQSEDMDLNREMSIKKLQAETKRLNGLLVSDEKELVELMFTGYQYDERRARYCVIPLQSNDEQGIKKAVQAFKDLFNLTFNIEDKQTLASAIATLIEMGKSRKNEQLDADLHKLNENHDVLLSVKKKLDVAESAEPTFRDVHSMLSDMNDDVEKYSSDVVALDMFVEEHKREAQKALTEKTSEADAIYIQLKQADKEVKHKEKALRAINSEKSSVEGAFKKKEKEIKKATDIISQYGSTPVAEIIGIYEDEIEKLEKSIKSFEDVESAQLAFNERLKEKNEYVKKRNTLQHALENNIDSFLFDVESHSADVLYQLMPALLDVTEMPSQVVEDAKKFASHFTVQDGLLSLNGKVIKKLGKPLVRRTKAQIEKEISKVVIAIEDATQDLEELKESVGSKEKLQASKQKASDELKKVNEIRVSLVSLDVNRADLEKQQLDLDIVEEQSAIKQKEYDDAKQIETNIRGDHQAATSIANELRGRGKDLGDAAEKIKDAKESFSPTPQDEFSDIKWPGDIIDVLRDAEALKYRSKTLRNQNERLKNGLDTLMRGYYPESLDPNMRHQSFLSYADMRNLLKNYERSFDELSMAKRRYFESVAEHHQLMINQKNELISAKNLLTTFIATINKEIGNVSISNIKSLTITAKISPDFTNLIDSLEAIDLSETQLVDKSVYEQLVDFAEKKMDKRTRRVKMDSIIEDIEYAYLLEGKDKEETKGQSGGTSSSITALIISTLLKRITPKFVNLKMPIIIDEIKTLDSDNADAMVSQIEEAGFSLLCATPEFDANTIVLTKNFVHLSNFSLGKTLMVPECSTLTLDEHIQGYGGLSPDVDALESAE